MECTSIGFFLTIPNRSDVFDAFCVSSLACRCNGLITMLLRDHLRPKNLASSPVLHNQECYFAPGNPGFGEARWIISGDAIIEHLLDVFIPADAGSETVWQAYCKFAFQLYWRMKPRLAMLGQRSRMPPVQTAWRLSCFYDFVGNLAERKRLLAYALTSWRAEGWPLGSMGVEGPIYRKPVKGLSEEGHGMLRKHHMLSSGSAVQRNKRTV